MAEKDDFDKRIDNGLKKKQLEEKYGARFSPFEDMPPELEHEWLAPIIHTEHNIWH